MRVLVTGNEGLVGRAICSALTIRDQSHVGFDIRSDLDILDFDSIRGSSNSCDAIVHSAALLGNPGETASQIMDVNLQGTWNVLQAAKENGISRVVFLSSVDVLGVFKGEKEPDFLPLDESHGCYPSTPCAISKYLAEEMCCLFASSNKMSILCLRPPGVWARPKTYQWINDERHKEHLSSGIPIGNTEHS